MVCSLESKIEACSRNFGRVPSDHTDKRYFASDTARITLSELRHDVLARKLPEPKKTLSYLARGLPLASLLNLFGRMLAIHGLKN